MPFTGSYADFDHVLGHELVHVFQYKIAESSPGGLRSLNDIPLWLIEGMAEYLSVGRHDPNTAMWLRDALRRNDVPTVDQLTRDSRYFPYRYGQALWAFIGGTWGDEAVNEVYRDAVAEGWEGGVKKALGVSVDSLSRLWHASIRSAYGPVVESRTAPTRSGTWSPGRVNAGAEHLARRALTTVSSPTSYLGLARSVLRRYPPTVPPAYSSRATRT
jgi:hypothetical protein